MPEGTWFIDPVPTLPKHTWQHIATDRPYNLEHGPSTEAEIQDMACRCDMAGFEVCLVATKRPRLGDTVHDLYYLTSP